jgi:hypothetical protein
LVDLTKDTLGSYQTWFDAAVDTQTHQAPI